MSNGEKTTLGDAATSGASADVERDLDELRLLSERFGVPAIDLEQVCIRLRDLEFLPREIAERRHTLPVLVHGERLFLAMADPNDRRTIDELEFVTAKRVFAYVASPAALRQALSSAYAAYDRGETHYAAPRCPPEVQRKALAREAAASERAMVQGKANAEADAGGPLSESEAETPKPRSISPHVLEEAAARDEITYSNFGDLNPELSVMTELPTDAVVEGHGATVLVVDDEPDIRRLLVHVLSEHGYRVLEADRGLEALRMVKAHMPDALVLDAMLPEVHGFDIARRIRGSAKYGHIPIVMVSAVYRGWRVAEDAKDSYGVDAFIEKPFRIGVVVAAVERALASAPAPQVNAADTMPPPVASPQTMPAGRPEGPSAFSTGAAMSNDAERFLNQGVTAYQAGDLAGAIMYLTRGLAIDPLAFRLRFHLGLLYGKAGAVYEAIGELERAIELNPGHFSALKNLAVLYQKAGLRQKALSTWRRASASAADPATAASIREHIAELANPRELPRKDAAYVEGVPVWDTRAGKAQR